MSKWTKKDQSKYHLARQKKVLLRKIEHKIPMEKKSYKKSSPEIEALRTKIEEKTNIKARTPADFAKLATTITAKTNENISPTTLKRLWGYIEGSETTRLCTLNILSNYLGFKHWEDFEYRVKSAAQSEAILKGGLKTDDLNIGDKIEINWNPDRKITVEYHGDQKFQVIKAENSKVSEGDTFVCSFFFLNEPLYVDKLVHKGSAPVSFVMGAKDGLTKIEKLS